MISPEVLVAAVESPYLPETMEAYKLNLSYSLDPKSKDPFYDDNCYLQFRYYQLLLKNKHS